MSIYEGIDIYYTKIIKIKIQLKTYSLKLNSFFINIIYERFLT